MLKNMSFLNIYNFFFESIYYQLIWNPQLIFSIKFAVTHKIRVLSLKSSFFSRLDDSSIQCHEEALVEDAKHYFDRQNPSVAKISEDKEVIKDLTAFDGGEAEEEYMSPVVSLIAQC